MYCFYQFSPTNTWFGTIELRLGQVVNIEPGFIAMIPEAYDESRNGWISCFYYCSHEGTDRNTIELMEINGDRARFRLAGETIDVNYYDGSKPATKLSVDIWFDRNRDRGRSMS